MKHMMFVLSLTLALAGTFVSAQTLAPGPITNQTLIANNDLVGSMTLTPGGARKIMLFRGRGMFANTVFVAVSHPTKNGPLGAFPGPGICFESSVPFSMAVSSVRIVDVDGDGRDDVVGYDAVGNTQVLAGIGLYGCN